MLCKECYCVTNIDGVEVCDCELEHGCMLGDVIVRDEPIVRLRKCMDKVKEILDIIRPDNTWKIVYAQPSEIEIDEWKWKYLELINGEDYFFIYIDGNLSYAVNVTGDNTLTAIDELVHKLSAKF